MKTSVFLIVNANGAVRVARRAFDLGINEVAFRLNVELPATAFTQRDRALRVKLTEDQLISTEIKVDVPAVGA
jgi:hypothetical protein